jgi:two-component system sensor histidine kinase LytS
MDTYKYLIVNLFSRLGMLFIFAFIVAKLKVTKDLIYKRPVKMRDKLILSIIFGGFGIMGTYLSIEFDGALINTRIIGVAAGGILGGPLVGLMTGLIAGIHRYFMPTGLFTQIACAVSVPIEGLIAGFIGVWIRGKKNIWIYAAIVGAICESLRKISVLVFSKPFDQALLLVKNIWFPMVLINSIGLALLFMIVQNLYRERERVGVEHVNLSINIIDRILPYIREGLYSEHISEITTIVYEMTGFDAVSITDTNQILAYSGKDSKKFLAVGSPISPYIHGVINTGEMYIVDKQIEKEVFFQYSVIAPLKRKNETIGTMKFYKSFPDIITDVDIETCRGLSKLFSTQLNINELESKSRLLVQTEIKALQAQINPHFLSNSLMVVASLCRTNPVKARETVLHLGNYFRKNIIGQNKMIELTDEIKHVKSYVEIEKARFEEKIQVEYYIDENIRFLIPPLTLQPIVENAIKHGILKKKNGGKVIIAVTETEEMVYISVLDNGVGIGQDLIENLLNQVDGQEDSIGLNNVNKRLSYIFGEKFLLKVNSELNGGTEVVFELPKNSSSMEG